MIISIDAEKAFDKIQHPLQIKTLNKLDMERMYLNIIKAIHDKSTFNIVHKREKLKSSPPRSGRDTVPTLTTSIQHSTGSRCQSKEIQAIRETKASKLERKK